MFDFLPVCKYVDPTDGSTCGNMALQEQNGWTNWFDLYSSILYILQLGKWQSHTAKPINLGHNSLSVLS